MQRLRCTETTPNGMFTQGEVYTGRDVIGGVDLIDNHDYTRFIRWSRMKFVVGHNPPNVYGHERPLFARFELIK